MMNRFILPALILIAAPQSFAAEMSVEQLAERGRKSLVVVTQAGRDGRQHGIGTGFVISADGLIATNLHVIGEGRAVSVELPDGTKREATVVHATDRSGDLAVIRIDAKGLKPLELGDSDQIKDGQSVVALGNPQGLKHSIVSGVVSGQRVLDGRKMIQLAIPLEPGNSGGPLLDRSGKVQGILTLKSAVTENLGFAMPVNALKPLLAKPNPVPIDKWLTIGALDPDEWQPMLGARWRQRAGRLLVEEAGSGFGGRSFCLSKRPMPELPFEVAVTVKLDDERGAAGLIFHADSGDKHYGFYPSGGELRLTRFDGPDVYSWKILAQKPSDAYRPGEWNTIKVRVEKGKLIGFVNDQKLVEITDDTYTSGRVGLAKFRDTVAEFKGFKVAKSIPSASADVESSGALRDKARSLEREAARLRKQATEAHQKGVRVELAKALSGSEDKIDLTQAALLVAQLDNDELDVDAYRGEVERMAKKLAAALPAKADDTAKLAALNKFLFADRGYHGSRSDYYHRSNSYLNEVIDDREGLPITLSVLYMDLARRMGLKIEGVGLPGHFVVRQIPAKGEPQLIDVFDGGKTLSKQDATEKVKAITGLDMKDDDLKPVDKRAIIVRMLHNLLGLTRDARDIEGALRYLDAIVEIAPDAGRERWMRAVLSYQSGRKSTAREDADWLLDHSPEGVDLDDVRGLRRLLDKP
jgi:regulator of sirC expression with transglutaminase-like and TPR domain